MSRIALARRAVRLFSTDYVPLRTNKFNRRAWLRSVEMLGDKWLLAAPMKRETAMELSK